MHKIALVILSLSICFGIHAQDLTWGVDFKSVFDNREGDLSNDKTIFFTRLSPEVGVSVMEGRHSISGGVVWYQPVGVGSKDADFTPTLYYHYHTPEWRVSFGMVPREMQMESLPKYLWSDSISYHQPNIRGVVAQYVKPKGYAEFVLDWRQLQTETQREAFLVQLNSRWTPKQGSVFNLGERLQYNHLAKQKMEVAGQSVVDDFMFNPYVGLNLSKTVGLDSLDIKVGAVASLQRNRIEHNGWQSGCGVLVEGCAEWRWLGVREAFYAGGNLMPLYPKFAGELNLGSPYYQSKMYSRTDVYAHIVRNKYIDFEVALNFHVTKNVFALWQQLALHVYIGNDKHSDARSKCQRVCNMY